MRRAVAVGADTYLRKPTRADASPFVAAAVASRDHLLPYVHTAEDEAAFRQWLQRGSSGGHEQYLVCRREDDALAGFVNLNNVTHGSLRSAAAGWAAFVPHAGRGHLHQGLALVLELAFTQLRLHRVEANIQPGNARSRRLAIGAGFRLEGFSPRYLQVGGIWRDHERWAILEDHWRTRA